MLAVMPVKSGLRSYGGLPSSRAVKIDSTFLGRTKRQGRAAQLKIEKQ